MKNKRVYLFTVFYPFGEKGESFVKNELEYLSQIFDEVIIVPTFIKGKKQKVEFENVIIDDGFAKKFSNLKAFFLALTSKDFYKELYLNKSILFSLYKIQRALSFFGRGRAIYNYLKNKNSDALFYSYWFNGVTYGLYLFKKKFNNIKYVFRVHRGDLYLEANKGYLPFRKPILENASKVYSISENGKNYIFKNFTKKVNIIVSRLGVKDFCNNISNKKSDNVIQIVSCSYVRKIKRVDIIYKLLYELSGKLSNIKIKWIHIGDGELFDDLKAKVKTRENFKIDLKGYMNTKEIYEFYKKNYIDLFINLSDSEGIPVSIMEAMCCKIPVVARDVGGIREIVNEQNGVLLGKEYEKEFLYKVSDLILDPIRLKEKRLHARKTFEELYNADINYNIFAKDLTKVINDKV